jgi:hypothetical protein
MNWPRQSGDSIFSKASSSSSEPVRVVKGSSTREPAQQALNNTAHRPRRAARCCQRGFGLAATHQGRPSPSENWRVMRYMSDLGLRISIDPQSRLNVLTTHPPTGTASVAVATVGYQACPRVYKTDHSSNTS